MGDCANNKMGCSPETASMFSVPVKSIIKSSRGCRMKLSILSEFQSAILAEVLNRNSSTILETLEAKREQRQTVEKWRVKKEGEQTRRAAVGYFSTRENHLHPSQPKENCRDAWPADSRKGNRNKSTSPETLSKRMESIKIKRTEKQSLSSKNKHAK